MLNEIYQIIKSYSSGLRGVTDAIWENPETAYKEFFAVKTIKDFLNEQGFEVTLPYCGIETAFRTEFSNGEGPAFAVCAEYDALPEIGHGCGHNLIAGAGIAAFLAIARLLKENKIQGKVVLFGTPGEEGGGGKVKLADAGCLEGIDAAIMVHPSSFTLIDAGSTANIGIAVEFHGKTAHAAVSPEKGINAMDAVNLVFVGVNTYRQYVPDFVRMHGVITDGGHVPNIIPDYARCTFYLRSVKEEWCPILEQRFRDIVKGAELMTGAAAEVSYFRPKYRARKPNSAMNQTYIDSMSSFGFKIKTPEGPGKGSTDFGNFSQVVPGIHGAFSIVKEGVTVFHTTEFAEAARTDHAFECMMKAAAAQAAVVYRFLAEKDFRETVLEDFRNN